jgi:hypothetical protein
MLTASLHFAGMRSREEGLIFRSAQVQARGTIVAHPIHLGGC